MWRERWVGAALYLIGLWFLFTSTLELWVFSMVSSAVQVLRQQGFKEYLGPFSAMLTVSLLLIIFSFLTGFVCIVAGAAFASPTVIEKPRDVRAPKSTEELYEKLLNAYAGVYGSRGKQKLDKKIGEYVNQGLPLKAAIQKLAEKEGYVE